LENIDAVDVRDVVKRLPRHFLNLSKNAAEIEEALSRLVSENSEVSPQAISTLQKIDFVRQALEDTSKLMVVLSYEKSATRSDLFEATKLESTHQLFTVSDSQNRETDSIQGGVDLF
jgi:hypothetical protein